MIHLLHLYRSLLPRWWCRAFIDGIPQLARIFSYVIEPVLIHGVAIFCFYENFSHLSAYLLQPIVFKPEFYFWKVRTFELWWGYFRRYLVVRVGERIGERLVIFAEKFVRSN